jgi:hypothetical protein
MSEKKFTNKEMVQLAFLTVSASLKAEHPDFDITQCEDITIKQFNESGIKCHLRKDVRK